MKYAIEIEKVGNGYIITDLTDMNTTDDTPKRFVYEEYEVENSELIAGQNMLWHIIDFFNLQGSKHDSFRLKVRLEKQGD